MLEFTPVPKVSKLSSIHKPEPLVKSKGIDEAFEEFLGFEVGSGSASPDTIANYKSQVKLYLEWCIDTEINPLLADKRNIQEYRGYLIDRQYKIATIELKLQVVRRFYDALLDHKLVDRNPAKTVKAPVRRRTKVKVRYLELDQLKQLLKLTEGDELKLKRDRVIIGLMALQGLRTVEVRDLNFGDIITQGQKKFILVASKRAERQVKLRDDVYSWILSHLAGKRLSSKLPIISSLAGNNYGKRMSRDGIRKVVNSYLERIGVRGKGIESHLQLSDHSLRHTFGTQVYAQTKDIRLVQEALGHSSPQTTAKYAHVCNEVHAADCIEI